MQTPLLCVRAETRQFSGTKGMKRLTDALDAQLRDGLIEELSDPAELTLGRDGTLPDGYRFTQTAYRQVCNLACPGLLVATLDLDGEDRLPEQPRQEYSFDLARKTYNQVIAMRFGRFAGRQRVLRDVGSKTIEGLLGPKYQPLDNQEVLEQATGAAQGLMIPAAFSWATLTGRKLLVRFAAKDPLFHFQPTNEQSEDGYRTGLHLANSEVGDESSFRLAVTLTRDSDGGTALGPFLGGRQIHAGRNLQLKVVAAMAETADVPLVAESFLENFQRLNKSVLNLDKDPSSKQTDRATRLVDRLVDAGAERRIAVRAVTDTANYGLSFLATERKRTGYDLYSALVGIALSLYVTVRETTEHAAWKLLHGQVKTG